MIDMFKTSKKGSGRRGNHPGVLFSGSVRFHSFVHPFRETREKQREQREKQREEKRQDEIEMYKKKIDKFLGREFKVEASPEESQRLMVLSEILRSEGASFSNVDLPPLLRIRLMGDGTRKQKYEQFIQQIEDPRLRRTLRRLNISQRRLDALKEMTQE